MNKNNYAKEVKIGIATILSLILLYAGINYLKGINLFKAANYYYVSCTNVQGINISSPVYVEGFKVGLVRSISYDYSAVEKITVEINLNKGMKINKGSYITIESTLLSGAVLNIMLNKYVDEYLKSGDIIEGRIKGGMMESVENTLLPQFTDLLPKIDSILTGLQTLINSPALSLSLNNLENTTGQLSLSSQQLNSLLRKDIPEITDGLKATSTNLSTFSRELNKLDLAQSINSLNATLDHIQLLTQKLNDKDNSLGLLMNDTSLYNNLNRTIENASSLLVDFKQNPKRYVRLSLF